MYETGEPGHPVRAHLSVQQVEGGDPLVHPA
ncbi:hypothetical protein SFUMM280S_04393 [Streptomyces fumanus]